MATEQKIFWQDLESRWRVSYAQKNSAFFTLSTADSQFESIYNFGSAFFQSIIFRTYYARDAEELLVRIQP